MTPKPLNQLLSEAEEQMQEDKKLFAAREVWQKGPSAFVPGKIITWMEWWETKFADNYKEYTARKAKEKRGG